MNDRNFFQKIILALGVICLLLGAGLTLWLGIGYRQAQETALQEGKAYTETQTRAVVEYIDAEMLAQKQVTEWMAEQMETGSLEREAAYQVLKVGIDERKPNLFGAAIGFAPNLVPGQELFAPFYQMTDTGQRQIIQVETKYDYTSEKVPTAVWYVQTAKLQKPGWYHYFGKAANDWLIVYAAPFYRDGKFAGVAASVHSVNYTFRQFLQNVPIGQEGYLVLLDEQGILVRHPVKKYNGETLHNVAVELKDPILDTAPSRIQKEDYFLLERPAAGGFKSWTTFSTLPSSKWHIAVVVRQDVKGFSDNDKIRILIQIGMGVILTAVGAAILVFKPRADHTPSLWGVSITMGMAFMLGIIWIWTLIYLNPLENGSGTALVSEQEVTAALKNIESAAIQAGRELPKRIPTGVVLETVSVTNRSAALTGYLWQKYPLDQQQAEILPPKFTNEIKAAAWKKTYDFVRNGMRVVGWSFLVELSEKFNVDRYPLDEITVKLMMEPSDLGQNIVFVPDLDSYDLIAPSKKPGLSSNLDVPGWNIRTSYFKYEQTNYNTDFGGVVNVFKNDNPLLVYNVHATRNLFSPLIAYTIVIYVVLVQIFGIVVLKIEKPLDVVSVGAALFLVNALKHNSLRTELAASGTIYLEYFFILLYVTILISSITSVSRTLNLNIKWLHANDNLLTKIMYWPLYLGISLAITLAIFYPK